MSSTLLFEESVDKVNRLVDELALLEVCKGLLEVLVLKAVGDIRVAQNLWHDLER